MPRIASETTDGHPNFDRSIPNRLFRARRTQLIGGLLLAISFFMPAIKSCGKPLTPYTELTSITANMKSLSGIAFAYTHFIAPYALGVAFALTAIVALLIRRPISFEGRIFAAILLPAVASHAFYWTYEIFASNTTRHLAPAVIGAILVPYATIALARGRPMNLPIKCITSWAIFAWFTAILITSRSYYGLRISATGAILIAIGTFSELRVRTLATIGQTLKHIILCNPTLIDLDPNRCNECGYNISHLTMPRCPECGLPFSTPPEPNL